MSLPTSDRLRQIGKRLCNHTPVVLLCALCLCISACSSPAPKKTVLSLPEHSGSYNLFETSRKAEQAYNQSRYIEAVQLYQDIVEQVPGDADALVQAGQYLRSARGV